MDIHVCLISSARLFEAQYGGDARFTNSFAKWLAIRKYRVTLIGNTFSGVRAKDIIIDTDSSNISREFKLNRSKVKPRVLYPPYVVYVASRLVMSLNALIKLIRIHKRRKIAIIHAQDTGYSGIAAILAGKLLDLPVVISSHGLRHLVIASQNKGIINKLFLKFEYRLDLFCVKQADGLIAVNQFIKEYFQDRIPESKSKIHFIPIPIRISQFSFSSQHRTKIRDEFRISDDSVLIGFVGRFVGVKNLICLLEAFSRASGKCPSVFLLLVGSGIQESDLKNLVKKRGLQNKVIFTGIRSDVNKILSALDIFILPSISEGLSTSLLEAMSVGRAIICSDIPGNRELVRNDESGVIVDPRNCDEITDAIIRLAMDSGLRSRMGEAAARIAKKYDEEAIFPLIERLYEHIVKT